MAEQQQKKKSAKAGRRVNECELYRRRGQREKNKLRKLEKRVEVHKSDKTAIEAIARLKDKTKFEKLKVEAASRYTEKPKPQSSLG